MNRRLGRPLIEQSKPLEFEFDGSALSGFVGDTLASALLANNVRVVGRSSKYHRPRGLFSDGMDEPNAMVELQDGENWRPNLKATEIPLYDGLVARSQNRWPSLGFDAMRVNDFLLPFISAGSNFKTFKYAKSFWNRVYEPVLRRSARLGRLPKTVGTDRYDRGFLNCDVLIIGAGLAGLYAAYHLAQTGCDILLVDGDFELGGRLLKDNGHIDGLSYWAWRDQMIAALRARPNVRIKSNFWVTGAYDDGVYSALETHTHAADLPSQMPRASYWRIATKMVVLATGAYERPVAFAGNDRPGVMLAGAVRGYLNRQGVIAGHRTAIFTNNDDGWRTAFDLVAAGHPPIAVIDPRADHGFVADFPIYQGVVTATHGRKSLRAITIAHDNKTTKLNTDILAVSGGWNPNIALATQLGQSPKWRDDIATFVAPDAAAANMQIVGAAAGHFDDVVIIAGVNEKLAAMGIEPEPIATPSRPYRITPLWSVAGKSRAWVDLQNDVTTRDIGTAHREGLDHIEEMKRYTKLGMGTDQGRSANVLATASMADITGQSIDEIGMSRSCPPDIPVPIGAMAAGAAGQGFRPHRALPSADFNEQAAAPTRTSGLWHLPRFYPQTGETHWRQSTDREVLMTRQYLGVIDLSSHAKFVLTGADAGAFLDLLCATPISDLVIGEIRHVTILREDSTVLDTGICARAEADRFVLTTRIADDDAFAAHMHFVRQCLAPQMRLQIVCVTDHFAKFGVRGPLASSMLSSIIDDDIGGAIGWRRVDFAGVEGWLFDLDASGASTNAGYDLWLPRRYGAPAFAQLYQSARAQNGGVYGSEASHVMRIEDGVIGSAEVMRHATIEDLDPRFTTDQARGVIGQNSAHSPHLIDTHEREQLVRIKPVGAVQKLLAGSRMVGLEQPPIRENLAGTVTSVCYSPTLGHMIGLALVKNGRNRLGDQMRAVDLVRDFDTRVEIVDPSFLEPKGGTNRG